MIENIVKTAPTVIFNNNSVVSKVLKNRPLCITNARAKHLRICIDKNLYNPYLVVFNFNAEREKELQKHKYYRFATPYEACNCIANIVLENSPLKNQLVKELMQRLKKYL